MPASALRRLWPDTTAAEARDRLLDQLQAGRRYLPVGEACPGFSFESGCPGHEGGAA